MIQIVSGYKSFKDEKGRVGLKKFRALFYCAALLLMVLAVTGCSFGDKEANKEEDTSAVDSETDENSSETDAEDQVEGQSEASKETDNLKQNDSSNDSSSESADDQSNDDVSLNDDNESKEDGVDLSNYSSEEIEYARVWHQLGPNQQIDTLYVTKIPAGAPINPNHEDVSATYPEDIVMLKGTRVVDGAVTYSGNGDGTINVYKVPARWDEKLGTKVDKNEIKKSTEMIAKETKTVTIKPFANEKIVEFIKKIKMN
jgi:hypothetical protein